MKRKKMLTLVLLIISFSMIAYGGFQVFMIEYQNHKTQEVQTKYAIQSEQYSSTKNQEYIDKFAETKSINPDFIGWLSFDSGLINTAIVQGSDNSYYLTHDFEGKEDKHGTPCLYSEQNVKTSANLTIFGHYVYADTSLMFSPLTEMMDPNNYETNKYFELYLDDQIRTYQVVSVIHYTQGQETLFAMSDFTQDQWGRYIQFINEYRLYDTGITAKTDGKYVVLQTCIRNARSDRLLVIGMEIEAETIDGPIE